MPSGQTRPAVGGDLQTLPYGPKLVTGIQGRPISPAAPSKGQALEWNGSGWIPTTPGVSVTDITSSGGSITVTNPTGPTTNIDLPASGVTAATYGDPTHVPQIAVNAKGIITSASNVAISGGGGSSPWTTITKASDLSRTSSVFSADPDLAFTTVADGDYAFEIMACYNGASTGSHISICAGEDSTTRGAMYFLGMNVSNVATLVGAGVGVGGSLSALGDTANRPVQLIGNFRGNGGTFAFNWCSKTGATVTLKAGSVLRYWQLR